MRRMSILEGSKYLFIGGIVAGAFAATSPAVHADGMAPKAKAVMEAPATWSGFYIGTNSGWATSSIDGTLGAGVGGPGRYSVDYDTEFWGLVLGVQHQFGGVVIGVEGNLLSMFADNAGSTNCPGNAALRCTARMTDILSIGGRLGVPMGHWMPYASGGYASSSFSYRANTAAPLAVEDGRTRNDGWYAGVGFDMVVAPGWVTGLEYRHYDFGDVGTRTFTPGPVVPVATLSQSATADTIGIRLTYQWDIPGRYAAPPLK